MNHMSGSSGIPSASSSSRKSGSAGSLTVGSGDHPVKRLNPNGRLWSGSSSSADSALESSSKSMFKNFEKFHFGNRYWSALPCGNLVIIYP